MKKHDARPEHLGFVVIDENGTRVARWGEVCLDCGRPVRRMFGIRRPGFPASLPTFWHAAGKPGPEDPRRESPRRESWSAAISQGMVEANARRKAARG